MTQPSFHLDLELHDAIVAAVEHIGFEAWTERVEAEVLTYMRRLGLSSLPRVRIHSGGARAITVRASGSTLSYRPSFLVRLWFGLAPREMRSAADGSSGNSIYPDAWLISCSQALVLSRDASGCQAVAALVAQLVLEVIALRPSLLVAPEEAAQFLAGEQPEPLLDPDEALTLFRALLDLGIVVIDRERIEQIVRDVMAVSRSLPDAFEEVVAHLRARCLEVQISPSAYAELSAEEVPEDRLAAADSRIKPEVANVLQVVYDYRLQELGLRLPLEFVRVDGFSRPEIRLKLNDRTSPSVPIPGAAEVAVTTRPAQLEQFGIDARPLIDPLTGRESAAVPEAAVDRLEAAGVLPIPRVAYMAAAFARAATLDAYRVISIDDIEEDLAALELNLPVLVHATLARYSLGEITRLLRALARELVSIRDLRRILDILLEFADATAEDLEESFLDDPLPRSGDRSTPVWSSWVEPRLLAFVRARLRDRVCYDSGVYVNNGRAAVVHETDAGFEDLIDLLTNSGGPQADELIHNVRALAGEVLEEGEREPIFITAARCRLSLRRAIEQEQPATRVLARAELPAGVRLRHGAPLAAGGGLRADQTVRAK